MRKRHQGNILSAEVPAPLAKKLRAIARASGVPLSVVIREALEDFARLRR